MRVAGSSDSPSLLGKVSDHIGDGQHGQGDFDETKNDDNEDDPEKGFLSQVFHDGDDVEFNLTAFQPASSLRSKELALERRSENVGFEGLGRDH